MANCIDCLHFDVCQYDEQEQAVINLKSSYRDISKDIADGCRFFKNKADFVEVKHGEWRISNRKEVCICSNCEKAVPFVLICTEPHKVEYDFCPHCGADMRKEGADNG